MNGYHITNRCNISLCSSAIYTSGIQSYSGPKYNYTFISLCTNTADYGHVPHFNVREEMLTEVCAYGESSNQEVLLYYMLCESIFFDDITIGNFCITPPDKVAFVDRFFKIPRTAVSRIIIKSPHMKEEGDNQIVSSRSGASMSQSRIDSQ